MRIYMNEDVFYAHFFAFCGFQKLKTLNPQPH